jgi:hypothetical protein
VYLPVAIVIARLGVNGTLSGVLFLEPNTGVHVDLEYVLVSGTVEMGDRFCELHEPVVSFFKELLHHPTENHQVAGFLVIVDRGDGRNLFQSISQSSVDIILYQRSAHEPCRVSDKERVVELLNAVTNGAQGNH